MSVATSLGVGYGGNNSTMYKVNIHSHSLSAIYDVCARTASDKSDWDFVIVMAAHIFPHLPLTAHKSDHVDVIFVSEEGFPQASRFVEAVYVVYFNAPFSIYLLIPFNSSFCQSKVGCMVCFVYHENSIHFMPPSAIWRRPAFLRPVAAGRSWDALVHDLRQGALREAERDAALAEKMFRKGQHTRALKVGEELKLYN